jgi:starvation-inducible DNA-binding protein
VGANFRSVHLQLDELVTATRALVDDVAERASALGVAPDGRAATVAKHTGLSKYPEGWQSDRDTVGHLVAALQGVISRLRPRIDETDKTDQVTQDLLIAVARTLEEAHWTWQAQLA